MATTRPATIASPAPTVLVIGGVLIPGASAPKLVTPLPLIVSVFARPGTPPDAETADADVALLRQLLSLT